MIKARVGERKRLFYFDTSAVVQDPSLLVVQVRRGVSVVAALPFALTTGVPNLYRSDPILLTSSGQYELVYLYDGVAVLSDYMGVDASPITDYPAGQEVGLKLLPGSLGGEETITVRIVTAAGEVGAPISAPYTAGGAAYQAPVTFPTVGDYCAVWYREIDSLPTPILAVPIYVVVPGGRERISFVARDPDHLDVTAPFSGATLVVSSLTGEWAGQAVTASDGSAAMSLPPGTYVASLIKSPYVFSTNNFTFTVEPYRINQTIQLYSTAFTVTVSPEQTPAPTCRVYASLYRMNGQPLANAIVRVSLMHRPQLFGGTPVFDTDLSFMTDSHGYVAFDLVQGVQVEISIAPLSIRRIITVPSGEAAASPVNLMTLMSAAQDLFDIVAPVLPAAAKRSL